MKLRAALDAGTPHGLLPRDCPGVDLGAEAAAWTPKRESRTRNLYHRPHWRIDLFSLPGSRTVPVTPCWPASPRRPNRSTARPIPRTPSTACAAWRCPPRPSRRPQPRLTRPQSRRSGERAVRRDTDHTRRRRTQLVSRGTDRRPLRSGLSRHRSGRDGPGVYDSVGRRPLAISILRWSGSEEPWSPKSLQHANLSTSAISSVAFRHQHPRSGTGSCWALALCFSTR